MATGSPSGMAETAKATRRLVIVIMWIFALTVAYPYIPGSSSAAFRGVSVFVGLMVSLGATGMVNQIVSGMVIVYTRAFRPGEYVRIGDTEGFVEEIGVLSTKFSTLRREHITIPNAVLVGTKVNNEDIRFVAINLIHRNTLPGRGQGNSSNLRCGRVSLDCSLVQRNGSAGHSQRANQDQCSG